jgi:hypothetical protein
MLYNKYIRKNKKTTKGGAHMGDTKYAFRIDKAVETAIDIGMTAGILLGKGLIEIDDSREFVATVRELAIEFEENFDEKTEDYIIKVDEFAQERLIQYYGADEDSDRMEQLDAAEEGMDEDEQ